MHTDRPILIFTLCTLLSILPGCATTSAPKKWLPKPDETQTRAMGGWIEMRIVTQNKKQHLKGELIAVHTDSVFVLAGTDLIALPKTDIASAKLTAYHSGYIVLIPWTFFGFVSTLSHGYFMVITLPVWIIFGSVSAIAQSHAPQIKKSRNTSWEKFVKYARYPQGLPPNLNRQSIAPVGDPT